MHKQFRNAISKQRLSSHRLHIESGSWNIPHPTPRENRLCSACNILEDEFYFMFECTLYNDERQCLIKPYYRRRYSMFKLIELFQSSNKNILAKLGNNIYKSFEKRTEVSLRRNGQISGILFVTLQLNTSIVIVSHDLLLYTKL